MNAPADLINLERYEIKEPCWQTPRATVFRAQLKGEKQTVLVKIPRRSVGEPIVEAEVKRDYRIAQELRSKYVAKVIDIERSRVGSVIVYADEGARPLAILSPVPLPLADALKIGVALAAAISDIHKEGLVHTNLNLNNVWLGSETEAIRISDFGLSRHPAIDVSAPPSAFPRDPRFTAPEQTRQLSRPVSQRTDIYAFGVILFYLITGRFPFDGGDVAGILDQQFTAPAVFPDEIQSRIPRIVTELILKCLRKDSEDRYATANGVKADLLECLSQLQSSATINDFALGERDVSATFRIPAGIYGRDAETRMLRRFVRRRGERPAVMLVTGPPGVGKTAFLGQLAEIVSRERGRFIAGKFDQYRRNAPYFPLVQALQDLVHQLLAESEERLSAYHERLLAACQGDARVVVDFIPDFELILGSQPPVAHLPPLEARNRFERVLGNLMRALAPPEAPLCLFMDDLQWADTASLELISSTLGKFDGYGLMFVAAYREGELSQSLRAAIASLGQSGIHCESVTLKPLELFDVARFIQDTINGSSEEALPLAELVHSRTQGNPLYLKQMLHFLHDSNLIAFDFSSGKWIWDQALIRANAVTENVLNLLRVRIASLPPQTRHLLSVAACLGTTFDTAKLAAALGRLDFDRDLAVAIQSDLLVEVGDVDTFSFVGRRGHARRFRFLHDRIQQAAFDQIEDDAKEHFRLAVGRRLLSCLTSKEKDEPQVDVLSNLNYAWRLIDGRGDREELARLNLIAGSKARSTLAYQDALNYLSTGIKLLGERAWTDTHEIAFELYVNALECEYLSGSFARAEELFALLLDKAQSKIARAKVFLTKILLDTSEERYEEAIQTGVRALRSFGIRYLRTPKVHHILLELLIARVRMRGRQPRDLAGAAKLTEPEGIAVLKILVALFPPAYFLNPNLLTFSALKVVNYSLRRGISALSAPGFVLYGLVLAAAFRKFRLGYEFGRFAVELAAESDDPAVKCKVLVIFAEFIKYWRDPIDDSFPLIERARTFALQAGDHQYVNYSIIGRLSMEFSRGSDIAGLRSYCGVHEGFVRESKDAFPIECILIWKSAILALTGQTLAVNSLTSDLYDEKAAEQRYLQTHNQTLLCYQYTLRAQLSYIFGRYESALGISGQADAVIKSVPGQITVADHYLYRGLAAAAILTTGATKLRGFRKIARRCLRELKRFAAHSPHNFLQYAKLLEAELARAAGNNQAAYRLYNEAIELAEQEKFHNLAAIAYERAALCSIADGQQRTAAIYLAWAKSTYLRWGASAKVEMMDREYAPLLALVAVLPHDATSAARSLQADAGSFDVVGAAEALQVAASEKGRDQVLHSLMQRIRAQCGAETACLISIVPGAHRIEAAATAQGQDTKREKNLSNSYSPTIVNYVVHAGTDVIVDDPHLDTRFAQCRYLATSRPKSVMCSAIVKQSELLGVIYVQHDTLAHAFDQNKLRWLHLAGSEVGLAIWGDRLTRFREYLHRFTPLPAAQEIEANPDNPNLSVRDRDVSILFADLAGYTKMHELMGHHEADSLVNRAFSEFVEEIHLSHGVVLGVRGDELLVLFQDSGHGGHAFNAARAALSIARVAAQFTEDRPDSQVPIMVNIGINSGPAAVGVQPIQFGAGAQWRYDVTGTTVNVAARIRELARNGHILVSAATAGALVGKFYFEDAGEHSLKNVSTPVHVLRLLGETT